MNDVKLSVESSGSLQTVERDTDFNALSDAFLDREDEFGRFERLTTKLLQVPKSELDEKLDESASSG